MRHLRLDRLEDFFERDADLHDPRRQVEDLAELAVRADQLVLAVEDGDALAHVIERGLQDFLVVVQRRVRVVEQLQRRLARDRPLAQQQRQHEARRGDADGRGDQMLGVAQQLEIRRRAALQRDAVGGREGFERCAGAVGAEILADRAHQVFDRDRGAPAAEVRRSRRELLRHEQVGLQMLDRRRLPRERNDDIGGEIEHQAPQHAVHQRRQVEPEQRLRLQRRDPERTLSVSISAPISTASAKLGRNSV